MNRYKSNKAAMFGLFGMVILTMPLVAVGFVYRACVYAFEIGSDWFDQMVDRT